MGEYIKGVSKSNRTTKEEKEKGGRGEMPLR